MIDSSVLIAMLTDEPDAADFEALIEAASVRLISAATYLETAMVIESRLGPAGGREFDLVIHTAKIEIVSVTRQQAEIGRHAFRTYGKGRHPAKLNLGDCFAYALSKTSGEPLLFKGADFAQTDVRAVAREG